MSLPQIRSRIGMDHGADECYEQTDGAPRYWCLTCKGFDSVVLSHIHFANFLITVPLFDAAA